MTRFFQLALAPLLGVGLLACSPAEVEDGWTVLAAHDWSINPGDEKWPAFSSVAPRDYKIIAIGAIAPFGTHHVDVLAPGPVHNMLFSALPGSVPLTFPSGVGLQVNKGDMLTLEMHLIDASPEPLSGITGIKVLEAGADAGNLQIANLLVPALTTLDLPPGISTFRGTCTLTDDQMLFAVAPHMHGLGTHLKTTLMHGSTATVLYDHDFDFMHQVYETFAPVAAHKGDQVLVDCTWNNTTGSAVHWGGSFTSEMCQAQVFRYPAGNGNFCTQ